MDTLSTEFFYCFQHCLIVKYTSETIGVVENHIHKIYHDMKILSKTVYFVIISLVAMQCSHMFVSHCFTGKECVFVKDMALCVKDRYHYLPEGYQHTILIRHPKETISRMYKMAMDKDAEGRSINQ